MWTQTVFKLLAFSAGGGILCGVFHSCLKCIRLIFNISCEKKRKFSSAVVFAEDVLFCLFFACTLCVVLYYGNSGNFRVVSVMGMMAGFAAFKVSLGALAEFLVQKFFSFVRNTLAKLGHKCKKICVRTIAHVKIKKYKVDKRGS